jgi:serine/threonine protein kinase
MGIREDAKHTLRSIAAHKASTRRRADGPTLQELTGLDPERLNDAIDQLEHESLLTVERAYNTQPYTFMGVELTVPGRLEAERLSEVIDSRWKTIRSIGEGGQGRTYLVQDTSDRSEGWVLKLLKNRQRLGRFDREIEALEALESDHIPRVRAYSLGPPAYVVTPYVGQDFTKHPRVPSLDTIEILEVFGQAVTAIADAHEAGVVHRDIKPNNLVLSESALHVNVIDFGICQYEDGHLTSLIADEAFGNPAFAAPECLMGREEEPTAACDVYSLGKVLYWLSSRGGYINRESLNRNRTFQNCNRTTDRKTDDYTPDPTLCSDRALSAADDQEPTRGSKKRTTYRRAGTTRGLARFERAR